MSVQHDDNSQDPSPYRPPEVGAYRPSLQKPPSDGPTIVGVTVVFSVPAAAVFVMSFLCFVHQSRDALVRFFLYGGHAILLALLLAAAVVLAWRMAHEARHAATVVGTVLGSIYAATLVLSWLVVAFFAWWESSMWT